VRTPAPTGPGALPVTRPAAHAADVGTLRPAPVPREAPCDQPRTTQTLDIPKDGFAGVGEGLGQAPTTVVELHVTG
ncbi:hypothetical protein ACFVXQ_14340, partial [Kitasatospora sp. NPDC058263]